MIESSAWDEVRAAASQRADVDLLSDQATAAIAQRFAARFVEDTGVTWWWTSVQPGVVMDSVEYGSNEPWGLVRGLIPPRPTYVLLVTDERSAPAGGVRGEFDDLRELIEACSFFEYLLTDSEASFGIFDTHDNTLVSVRRS